MLLKEEISLRHRKQARHTAEYRRRMTEKTQKSPKASNIRRGNPPFLREEGGKKA